jgi:hypothetical protein
MYKSNFIDGVNDNEITNKTMDKSDGDMED